MERNGAHLERESDEDQSDADEQHRGPGRRERSGHEDLTARGAVFRRRHRVRGPIALYGGRIDPGKGCEELLEYFSTYVKDGGDATLMLMGVKLMARSTRRLTLTGEGERALGDDVVGEALGKPRNRVRARGDDGHHPRGAGRVEVRVDRPVRIGVVGEDVAAAEARERRLAHEAARRARHRHLDGDVGLDERTHDLARAIRRDAAGDREQDGRRPVRGGYASGVSHAILSAATSSSAIVR